MFYIMIISRQQRHKPNLIYEERPMSFLLEVFSAPKDVVPFTNLVANDGLLENLTPQLQKIVENDKNAVWNYVGSEQLYKLFEEVLGKEIDLDTYNGHYIRLDYDWICKLQKACKNLFKDSWRERDQAFHNHFEKMINKYFRSVAKGNREFYMCLDY